MKLCSETFDSDFKLTRFVNDEKIAKENIQQITHAESKIGYTRERTYTLFYWR